MTDKDLAQEVRKKVNELNDALTKAKKEGIYVLMAVDNGSTGFANRAYVTEIRKIL